MPTEKEIREAAEDILDDAVRPSPSSALILARFALRILAGPTPEQVERAAKAEWDYELPADEKPWHEQSEDWRELFREETEIAIKTYIAEIFTESQVPSHDG